MSEETKSAVVGTLSAFAIMAIFVLKWLVFGY